MGGEDSKGSGKAWVVLRTVRYVSRLSRPVITRQGLGPLGVHMGCGGMSDAKGLFCERGSPEAFGMDLE